ncbi:hypothetical protein CL614_01975 [archaeon]|nr:hypothetical protein [archaeon]|tara:strand:- start:23 stop:331 length:309 start_codon:yes stop_codon:yes gene_type:complete
MKYIILALILVSVLVISGCIQPGPSTGPLPSEPYDTSTIDVICGDGMCHYLEEETSANCPEDCGYSDPVICSSDEDCPEGSICKFTKHVGGGLADRMKCFPS